MQVKTFIYGTPLGFNFYEDDSLYKDYFKAFYISSRKGRRLMVNRLDNGETTYNFLCYRIAEAGNRPNAFFGMSLVLGDYQYCSDISKLYDWFNFLFNKLINERKLFNKQGSEDGLQLQYNVAKFAEDTEDVEWLKTNIPNILSSPEIKLLKYDASFSNKVTGKIAQFNNEEKPENILKAFKQYRWICLSPLIDNNPVPELDYGELSSYLDGTAKKLLPIAISPEKKHLPLLKEMFEAMKENYNIISDFIKKTKDEESKSLFAELGQRYYDILANQLPQIAKKIEDEAGKNPPPTSLKTCSICGKQKPVNAFAEGDSICAECRANETQEEIRICKRCGKRKPIGSFSGGDTICLECRNHEKVEPTFPFPLKYLYGGIAAVVLVVVIVCAIIFIPFKQPKEANPGDQDSSEQVGDTLANKVDAATYNSFIAQQNFSGAYNCIKDKDDASDYKAGFKNAYEKYLTTLNYEQILRKLLKDDAIICKFIGIDNDKWTNFVNDGERIDNYLSKATLSDSERRSCQNLIEKYKNNMIYNDKATAWQTSFNKKKNSEKPKTEEYPPITIKSYNSSHQQKEEKTITGNSKIIGLSAIEVGGYVDVYCSQQPSPAKILGLSQDPVDAIKQKDGQFRIKPRVIGKWVYNCDYGQITIQVTKPENE